MDSPITEARKQIQSDFRAFRGLSDSRLVPEHDRLPTQMDRQIDVIETPPAGGGGFGTIYPFDVVNTGVSTFTVQPGTVNGLLASNYSNTFTLSLSTTYYLIVELTASDGQITGVTLDFATSAPDAIPTNMGQPPTSFNFLLGILVTDGVGGGQWFRTIGPGSLSAAGQESFRTDKSPPSPGTLPYDIWYTWTITQA